MPERNKTGPRGGLTTTKKGQIKKTLWLNLDEAEAIRAEAFKRRVSEVSILREALRRYFKLPE